MMGAASIPTNEEFQKLCEELKNNSHQTCELLEKYNVADNCISKERFQKICQSLEKNTEIGNTISLKTFSQVVTDSADPAFAIDSEKIDYLCDLLSKNPQANCIHYNIESWNETTTKLTRKMMESASRSSDWIYFCITSKAAISNQNESECDEYTRVFAKGMKIDCELVLKLRNIPFGMKGVEYLAQFISSNEATDLELRDCHFSLQKNQHFFELLMKIPNNLKWLELDSLDSPECCKPIRDFLVSENCKLLSLLLTGKYGWMGAFFVSEALRVNQTLTFLRIREIGDQGMSAIFDCMTENSTLETLVISNIDDLDVNFREKKGFQSLFNFLKKNSTLRDLRLGFNTFEHPTPDFLKEIARIVKMHNYSLSGFLSGGTSTAAYRSV